MRARVCRQVVPMVALLLGACTQSQVGLSIKSPTGTNMGRPMYMLIRQVDPKQYANEEYSQVAAKIGAPDPSVLRTAVIYPGTVQRFQVQPPKEGGAMAVSFLFTAPDGNWQLLLSPPLPRAVDVELAVSRILSDSVPPALPAGPAAQAPPKLPGS